MNYQVGFTAFGGDSRVKEEGWGYELGKWSQTPEGDYYQCDSSFD